MNNTLKQAIARVATLESGIITTTPATADFFADNPTFRVNVLKDSDGRYYASFLSTTTGEKLKTSHLTNDIDLLRKQWQGRYVRITTANSTINIWFNRTQIQENEYVNKRIVKVLCEGSYKEYDYKILSYGTHPCAYIALKGQIADLQDYDDFPAMVHGGATFLGKLAGIDENDPKTYVGWDYAHCDDYSGYLGDDPSFDGLKRWTTEEILLEVYDAIDQLIKAQPA